MPLTTNPSPPHGLIPSVPVISLASFYSERRTPIALSSLLDTAQVRLVTSGRIAIGLALRALRVGAGDTVLVPAYHSPSMIPPVYWCGAEVVFYRVHADTMADLADITSKINSRVKAIIVTHFFGIPQDLTQLRALCDRYGIGLVEDCAHCFFGTRDGVPVGTTGDYAIGSSMKFFPIYEGGCLVSHRHTLDTKLFSAGIGFEAKAALNVLETSFIYGRMKGLRLLLSPLLNLKNTLWNALKTRARKPDTPTKQSSLLAPSSSDSSFDFDPRWTDKRSSRFSRLVIRFASHARIVARRRSHYLALQESLTGMPGWRPLFTTLPEGACPWVFPLLAERPEPLFEVLQAAGVPMVRFGATLWPGVDESVCSNSMELGRHLIAFPCHQELSDVELACMSVAIRDALCATMAVPA
jgi:perosamine synthetase